jgi:endonuclease-3
MATTTQRQQLLTQVYAQLRKEYEPRDPERRPVLEQLLYAICREGATREQADQAFANLRDRFFDWNEVRVSTEYEVEEALAGLPDARIRSNRIIGLLQQLFEREFRFDLDDLTKEGVKVAVRRLGKFEHANDFCVAFVVQQALGGHAVPLDEPTLRVLRRLGLAEAEPESQESLRAGVEHVVPKAKAPHFGEMISLLARDVCWEQAPNCPACALKEDCPTGQGRLDGASEVRGGRLKPR